MKNGIIIVAAPSGAGKSSFVDKITQEMSSLVDVITYTTRPMRAGESQGKPYFFTTKEDFQNKIEQGFFVEYAKVHTNMYGTPIDQILKAWQENKSIIMDIDVQGAETFRAKFPDRTKTIFILPPSIDELRRRVIKRDGGIPADLEIRMQNALKEIDRAKEFDYQLINDQFETSYSQFKKIIEEITAN